LCLLAPAFFLRQQLDRKFRLIDFFKVQRFFTTRDKGEGSAGDRISPFAYQTVPVGPATSFHHHTRMLRRRVHQVGVEVLHLHGTCDQTTPLEKNHRFLQNRLTQYRFQTIEGAGHVLPLSRQAAQVAELHQTWLKKAVL
jgi:pimeloyl-ACP methyl ester carboxylesterase